MTPITNDSTQVSTGYLGYQVPVADTQTPIDKFMNKLRSTAARKQEPMSTGYLVPADTTKAKLPTSLNRDKIPEWIISTFEKHKKAKEGSVSQSKPVTIKYPNGQWKKINGEWKKVVSETFIPATTPEEKKDLMNKWLNNIR